MMANNQSLTMEPEARQLKVEVEEKLGELTNQLSQNQNQSQVNNAQIEKNISDIIALRARIDALGTGGSPNTAGNPALLDRFPLQPADVVKMLHQSAEQKAQGQAYAGKYSLTPQRFDVDANGRLSPAPYGLPPTDGVSTHGVNDVAVPIITDSVSQFYDASTGIHYRWDQYQHSSQSYQFHWTLDGPVTSVSLDGLKWVSIRTILYGQIGPCVATGIWYDRDNRLGQGPGTLLVSAIGAGSYCLPTLTSAGGKQMSGNLFSGDHRVYWDSDIIKGFVVLGINNDNNGNNYIVVRTGSSIGTIADAYIMPKEKAFGMMDNNRCECPSWVRMNDQVPGQPQRQVLSMARQQQAGMHYETMMIATCKYSVSEMSLIEPFRYIEYGSCAYAQVLVDPMQQDGTGSTKIGCDVAVMNNGSYNWSPINGNWQAPSFGFGGGQWIPAEVVLVNGIPLQRPSSKFAAAMTGRRYTQAGIAQGGSAVNPGWLMAIGYRCDVWRAQMDVADFSFPVGSTIRFHFGGLYADYTFSNGVIDFIPNYSGKTVWFPNNQGGVNDTTTRRMPMTRDFVTSRSNTLVWEYDYGRLRLYNLNTGETMSEIIFPNGLQLSAIEVLGNDFFVGGFTMTVNQDEGQNY